MIRNATPEDIKVFFPEGLGLSMQAVVFEDNGIPIGIGGRFLKKGATTAFLKIINPAPKAKLYKVIKKTFLEKFSDGVVTAIRDQTMPNSKKLLEKLGFVFSAKINNEEIWILCQHKH